MPMKFGRAWKPGVQASSASRGYNDKNTIFRISKFLVLLFVEQIYELLYLHLISNRSFEERVCSTFSRDSVS